VVLICYCVNVARITQKVPEIPAHHGNLYIVFALVRYVVIYIMVFSNTFSTHKPTKI
jgi:hypothetical protein